MHLSQYKEDQKIVNLPVKRINFKPRVNMDHITWICAMWQTNCRADAYAPSYPSSHWALIGSMGPINWTVDQYMLLSDLVSCFSSLLSTCVLKNIFWWKGRYKVNQNILQCVVINGFCEKKLHNLKSRDIIKCFWSPAVCKEVSDSAETRPNLTNPRVFGRD